MRAVLAGFFALLTTGITSADDGFVPLFDGKTLTGWSGLCKPAKDGTIADWKQTWTAVAGELRCTGKPNGYIATTTEYSSYILRLKWKYPADSKAGNGGVLLHAQKDRYWPHSIEAQLKTGQAGDLWLQPDAAGKLPTVTIDPARFDTASADQRHYFRIGKDMAIEKPLGEWNQYEITCKNGEIVLVINGTKVNEATGCSLTKGRIALQSEGSEAAYKDLEIKLLK